MKYLYYVGPVICTRTCEISTYEPRVDHKGKLSHTSSVFCTFDVSFHILRYIFSRTKHIISNELQNLEINLLKTFTAEIYF